MEKKIRYHSIRVHRTCIRISLKEVKSLRTFAQSGFVVFNPDNLRVQRGLNESSPIYQRVKHKLTDLGLLEKRLLGDAVVLHSFAGCQQQEWHTDFDPNIKTSTKPIGVIVALENDTKFETPKKTYYLNKGDILCFDGDVIHAGSSYTKQNTRLHFYLDVPNVKRLKNKTWLVEL